MNILSQSNRAWVLLALIALMLATRFHHFGSVSLLPDASLAVFFLAGFYLFPKPEQGQPSVDTENSPYLLGNIPIFAMLIVIAGLVDYLAINQGGVSDWCVTPAYLFLIPTYALMSFAGKWCTQFNLFTTQGALKTVGFLLIAISLAFVLSNASFYLFSGRYGEMDWLTYGQGISRYYLPYAAYTLLYCSVILTVQGCLQKALPTDWISKLRIH